MKNQYIGGIAQKWGLGQFVDLRGACKKEGGGCFLGGDTPMPTMLIHKNL